MQKVLVIDDDDALRDTISVLREAEGSAVETSSEGRGGYQRALALQPHLVLVDLNLPGLVGSEICRRLEHGADDYVVKPFRPRELVARIRAEARYQSVGDLREDLMPLLRRLARAGA